MKWKNKGHEFDNVGHMLKEKDNIYLYGAGKNAKEILFVLEKAKKWIPWDICLVDQDESKQRSGWQGYPVISPDEFLNRKKNNYFVVICPGGQFESEIFQKLIMNNIPRNLIFRQFSFLYIYLSIWFLYEHDMVFFNSINICPSTICNLNCRDCLNFTPHIKEHVVDDIESVKHDIDLLFNSVDLIYRLQITGGEPLLYKNLKEVFNYIDENYRHKIFRLEMVTNGTIVPSDEICSFLHDKDIYVFLDDYRMSLSNGEERYEAVRNQLEKFDVTYEDNHVDLWIRMYPGSYAPTDFYDGLLDSNSLLSNEMKLVEKFTACNNPWTSLHHGKLSSCNYAMYAEKAGICKGDTSEYYDLEGYNEMKKHELIEFRLRYNLKGYTEFCKQCGGWTATNKALCKPAIQAKRV